MKLTQIDIKNFRSIKNSSILFDDYPCRILIGMNETGKTNILKAIKTLDSSYNIPNFAPMDKRVLPSDEENYSNSYYVNFCFKLEEKEMLVLYNKLKSLFCCNDIENIKIFQKAQETFTLLELIRYFSGVVKRVDLLQSQRYTIIWPNSFSVKDFSVVSAGDWRQIPSDVSVIINKENKVIAKNNYKYIKMDEFPAQTVPFKENMDIKSFNTLFFSEVDSIVNRCLPQIIFWKDLEDHAFPVDINIQNFIIDPDTYPHFKSMCLLLTNLFPNADSIAQVFTEKQKANQLGILFKQISDKTTDYLRAIWDDFANERLIIDTSKGNQTVGISVVNELNYSNPFPTIYRSDGFKKFLKLMLNLSLKIKSNEICNSIILIDEAELYLHPPAAEDFRDELLALSEKNNNIVVFSTHSPFMIDGNAIRRNKKKKKEKETTILKEGEEGKWFEEELLWQALGCGIIRTLPHRTLIFEGWDDKVLFKNGLDLLEKADKEFIIPGDKSKMAIAHASGASNIRHCLPAFQAANSTAIIVCDSDPAGKNEKDYCKANRLWGYDTFYTFEDLGGKENETAEDYLKTDRINYAIEIIKKKYEIRENPDFSVNECRIMPQIKLWLQSEKNKNLDSSTIIEDFKELLFRKLKSVNIKDEYKAILKNLNKKLAELKM
jgi:predicted ATP-dependent endonuclease of OLD family